MVLHSLLQVPLAILLFSIFCSAEVTIYTSIPLTGFPPSPAATATCISASACDNSTVNPIAPGTTPANQIVQVQLLPTGTPGLGIHVNADFAGFSIELSIANSIIGNDGNKLKPIFLNLMQNIVTRAGRVMCRVGGNSQESATVVPGGLPNDTAITKTNKENFTPTLFISPTLIYAMGNSSKFVNIDWFIGLPFNDTTNPRPELAEIAQKVLGSHLLGMQLGNEPDLYPHNGSRNLTYQPQDYTNEWAEVLAFYKNDPNVQNTTMFVGPSVCCGQNNQPGWIPEQVWDTGYLQQFKDNLAYISVEHYPTNNCGSNQDPNVLISQLYLNHSAVSSLSQPYINSSTLAQGVNKPFIMFETNTASCGGFAGFSDTFASALWALDYNLNMAVNNFTNALYHIGGQKAIYNPFTPPPTNQTKFRQWTIGPVYYSVLATAEAIGRSGTAQVADLGLNNNNDLTPGYVITENGAPQRVMLFNFLTDPSGASNYTAYISVGGNTTNQASTTPSSVKVKYLLSPSAAEKWNITWAGQTFGGPFATNGLPMGDEFIYTVTCDTASNICPVTVPAPGAALVFLTDQALQNSDSSITQTFTTTATGSRNTASIDPQSLLVSNGHGGQNRLQLGSTSPGNPSSAAASKAISATLGVSVLTAWIMLRLLVQ